MKRMLLVFLMLMFSITISACGLLGGEGDDDLQDIIDDIIDGDNNGDIDEKDVAQRIADAFNNDLSHLSSAMEAMNLDDAFEMSQSFLMQVDDTGDLIDFELESRLRGRNLAGVFITEMFQSFRAEHHGLEESYEFTLHLMIAEHPEHVDIYLHRSMIDSMISYFNMFLMGLRVDERENMLNDFLDLFDMNEDWLRFRIEDSMANIIELEILETMLEHYGFEDLLDEFYDEFGLSEDTLYEDVEAYYEKLREIWDQYFDFSHIGDTYAMDIELDVLEDQSIQTIIKMPVSSMVDLFEDLFDAYFDYLVSLDELDLDSSMHPGSELFDEMRDELMEITNKTVDMKIIYDPITLDAMSVEIELLSLLEDMLEDMGEDIIITSLAFSMHVKNTTSLNVPTRYGNVNDALLEGAKVLVLNEAISLLKWANNQDVGTYTISDAPSWRQSVLFDAELTEFTVLEDDVLANFYYVGGDLVFADEVSYNAMSHVVDFIDSDEVPTREDLINAINTLNHSTFSLTRLIALLLIDSNILDEVIDVPDARSEMIEDSYLIMDAVYDFCDSIGLDDYNLYCVQDAPNLITAAHLEPFLSKDMSHYEFVVWNNYWGDFLLGMLSDEYYFIDDFMYGDPWPWTIYDETLEIIITRMGYVEQE